MNRRRAIRLGQIVVTLGLLGWLGTRLDLGAAWQRVVEGAPLWVLAALLLMGAQTLLAALRWRLTARAFGLEIGAAWAIREYFLAQIVNQLLPGGVLGDVGRAIRARGAAGLARAGNSVLMERLWGQIVHIGLMLAAVAVVTATPGGLSLPPPLLLSLGAVALGIVLALALVAAWPGGRIAATLRIGLAAPGIWPRQALQSLGTVALNLLAFACCARATGTALGPSAILTLVPVILFAMVIPLTISGWGLRESAAAALFPLAGASAEAGLAASVVFGLTFLASSLPGLMVLLLDGRWISDTSDPDTLPTGGQDH